MESTMMVMPAETLSKLVLKGDLSSLNPKEKMEYYVAFCQRLGLDPATQPFKILNLKGREVLYCGREGTQQLGNLKKISHRIEAREVQADCYVVTATAFDHERQTTSIGAVSIGGLKGDELCNAMMKAETKAKRRATLDLCGLGMLDESEIETIPNARKVDLPNVPSVNALPAGVAESSKSPAPVTPTPTPTKSANPQPQTTRGQTQRPAQERSAGPPTAQRADEPLKWRNVLVQFGKNKGVALGDLSEKSIKWYYDEFEVQETYEQNGETKHCTAANIAQQTMFRNALDLAGEELSLDYNPK